MAFVGFVLLFIGYSGAAWMGAKWLTGEKAGNVWWMNPHFSVPAPLAIICFAILPLLIGGVLAGIALPLMFFRAKKGPLYAAILFFIILALTALGFNTFDYALAWDAGAGGELKLFSLWSVGLPGLQIPAWYFYFFFIIMPLWAGGFLIGLACTLGLFNHKLRK